MGSVKHYASTRRRFWDSIRVGLTVEDAAVAAGVSCTAGWRWFREAGGVNPTCGERPPRYRRLSIEEREQVHAGMHRGE